MLLRLIMLFMVALIPLASAQNYFATPKHDPNDPNHWYDLYCCSLRDCAPVTNWEDKGDFWIITNKMGLKAKLPKDYMTNKQTQYITKKPSKDAEYHACITIDMKDDAFGNGRVQCLYIPMNM